MGKKKEIFEHVAKNPREGVKLIYESYGKKLYSYGIKTWKLNEDECWEIVYKTIYRVAEKTKAYQFSSESNYRSFIFTIFINFLKNYFNSRKKEKENFLQVEFNQVEVSSVNAENNSSIETESEQDSEAISLLKEELEKMDDWERILLLMRCQDIPYIEISKIVDKPTDHLKVYYQRLKSSVLKKLEKEQVFKKMNADEK